MKDNLRTIHVEDNGDFVSGVNKVSNEQIHVTYKGNILALKYDFSVRPGKEFAGLTVIHEWNLGSKTVPESKLAEYYLPLGEAVTESAIGFIKKEVKPLIDQFKQAYDQYHSGGNTLDFDELGQKYSEMTGAAAWIVEDIGLGWDAMRTENETDADVYYADPETLDALVAPDMTDEEIEAIAREETFVNGMLFHPQEIAGVLLNHRDYQVDHAN
ncbi:hypothetical protein Q9252_15270 [Marinobacter salarius]|uniref:hypothetical protein n=1 Tax=Marinobacter salarius TaxID=1420917 RepID=UPI00273BF3B2|nr:hypothetical protein [Marinobacter salarius]MDP4533505.1 hypothetical protein [Marinobacter salarius]